MLRTTADIIVSVTGGELVFGDASLSATGIAVDSRLVEPGAVFVALPGASADGHDYLGSAIGLGARVLVVTRGLEELGEIAVTAADLGVAVVRVGDATRALQDIAAWHRSRLHCAVVGVSGSSGKTTTKDFLFSALATCMNTVSTEGNRNNEIGVPLTLLGAASGTDALVVEMGMRGIGQIARLCEITRPGFGLVTNVGTSHLELLGSQEAVASAKSELVRAIPSEGEVFLNGDDGFSTLLAQAAAAPVTLYGLSDRCSVRAEELELDDMSCASFLLVSPQGSARVSLPVPGRHNVYNALAAAAVALRLAVPLDSVARGLCAASVSSMRMESFTTAGGITIINDAYNANPSSMAAAVETLSGMHAAGRRIAVLGDMAELGSLEELAHFQIGEQVASAGIDVLVTVGERATRIADGARAAGMDDSAVRPCEHAAEAVEVLDDVIESGDTLLVKASRVMGLEAVVEGIVSPRVR